MFEDIHSVIVPQCQSCHNVLVWLAWVLCDCAPGVIRPHWQCSHSHSSGLLTFLL